MNVNVTVIIPIPAAYPNHSDKPHLHSSRPTTDGMNYFTPIKGIVPHLIYCQHQQNPKMDTVTPTDQMKITDGIYKEQNISPATVLVFTAIYIVRTGLHHAHEIHTHHYVRQGKAGMKSCSQEKLKYKKRDVRRKKEKFLSSEQLTDIVIF